LASMRGSPEKLNIAVLSVKKSTYFEPAICTRFSAGFPLAWLTEEVADAALAVDVALSVAGTTAVDVAAVVEAALAAIILVADVERVEFEVSARKIAGSASVAVASVVIAVNAETMPVLKVPRMMRLMRRTLAAENAIVWVFINSVS
jgi:hypothetical protein